MTQLHQTALQYLHEGFDANSNSYVQAGGGLHHDER